jgi:hypothetical protein
MFSCGLGGRLKEEKLTAMKESRLGGQEQGILIPLMPSQSPVPVGLVPAFTPNWGTSAGLTPLGAAGLGAGFGAGLGAGFGAGLGAGLGAAAAWRGRPLFIRDAS